MNPSVQAQLSEIVGAQYVVDDPAECAYYSQDVFSAGETAIAVVRPASAAELARVVGVACKAGIAVVTRGGGMSYSGGYLPAEAGSITIDMSRMNRVLAVNADDMYVTVEAGITWEQLHQALADTGLRTPYWGTLSGRFATVGGSVSQNSIFWGSGQHGSAVDSVLGLKVALADGQLLDTGSAAQRNASPFFRHYGPDLTGLFCADCGALGIKAEITLRLIYEPPSRAFGSFAFERYEDMLPAMAEISRRGLAAECFGFDPYLQSQRMKRESLGRDAGQFLGVLKSAGGLGKAIKDGLGVAMAGRRYMDDVQWSFHTMIEERTDDAAAVCLATVREIVAQHSGRELPDSIPKLVRANPFGPVNNMIGPAGERWVPVHGLVAHSRAVPTMDACEAVFARYQAEIEQHEIGIGYLLATVSTHCSVLEPVFFWPDALEEMHRRSVDADHLARLKGFPANPAAREVVTKIRKELTAVLMEQGAVHLQVGKSYRYEEGLQPANFDLLRSLKQVVDPQRRINPGVLGL